jgi:hypothetical protein
VTSVSPTGAMWTAIAAIVVAVIGGYFGWRNSGRALMSKDQREWLTTSLDEARKAKVDANAAEESAARANRAANEANVRADQAVRKADSAQALAEDLVTWIGRVVRAANDVDPQQVDNPHVQRLLTVINGGPASLSNGRLHGGDREKIDP